MKPSDWLRKITNLEFVKKLNLSKKTAANLVIIFCIGITCFIVADFVKDLNEKEISEPEQQLQNTEQDYEKSTSSDNGYAPSLEKELSEILSKIQNAGDVCVMITLESSSEIVPAKDESISDKVTNEKDTEGGTRVINESNTSDKVVFKNMQGGNSEPLIVKEINPEIKGVIVVAEGAKDPKIKLKLTQAVVTVLDIPSYRVTVYEKE